MENIPQFMEKMLKTQYGEEVTAKIMQGYKEKPVTLRINTIKAKVEDIKEKLKQEQIQFSEVPWSEVALIINKAREEEIRKLDIYEKGEIYLQSLSSMLPPIMLQPKQGENILDMAAAPGGKTTQIAAICNNRGMITACEKNKIRADRLKYNLQKQGVTCVNIMQVDSRKLDEYFSFDKILLDAPCSGSGTLNINNINFTEELIERAIRTQEELLKKALSILKKGGEMIYSTCSILSVENEKVLTKILPKFNASVVPIDTSYFEGVPLLPVQIAGTVCVCPTNLYEGFFVAKIFK